MEKIKTNSLYEERRFGKFFILADILRDESDTLLKYLSPRILVYFSQRDSVSDMIEIHAYSPEFDPVPEGAKTPEYKIMVTKSMKKENKVVKIRMIPIK